jgi:GNAT superfamily N-acetyltransferase
MQNLNASERHPSKTPARLPARALAHAPGAATCNGRILTGSEWLDTVLALHNRVRAELPESRRHFLLPKTSDYFRALLEGKGGYLIGAFADDELVGSLALAINDSLASAHTTQRLTCPDANGHLAKTYGKGTVGVLQSMGVLSPFMGRGVSRALLQTALTKATRQGCAHVFAQIAAQNTLSWLRFMDRDFALIATWVSGHRRFLLRWLPPEEKTARLHHAAHREGFIKNYSQMPALLAELTAELEQGRIVVPDNTPEEPGALSFVFS